MVGDGRQSDGIEVDRGWLMLKPLPPTAPRGKTFRVLRMNHVAGGQIKPLIYGNWSAKDDAEKAVTRIDARLQPSVILADVEQRA